MEDYFFVSLAPMGGGRFYFLAIGLEYIVCAHLAEIANMTGCDLDKFSHTSLEVLDAESERK